MQIHNSSFETTLRSHDLAQGALSASPLSSEQKRRWLLAQLTNFAELPVSVRYKFSQEPDLSVVQQNLGLWVENSEALRSYFVEISGKPVRLLMPTGQITLEYFSHPLTEEELCEHINEPFSLASGPLTRAYITKLGTEQFELILVGHPIAVDEYTLHCIAPTLLSQQSPTFTRKPVELAEAFQQENAEMSNEQRVERWINWGTELQLPSTTEIATDLARPEIKGYERQVYVKKGEVKTDRVKEVELISSWLTILMRWQGSQSAMCGVSVRDFSLSELAGPFQTWRPVRADMEDNSSLEDLHQQVREQINEENLPSFASLLELCPPPRNLSRTPYFQTGLRFIDCSSLPSSAGDIDLKPEPCCLPASDLDLSISCWVDGDAVTLVLDYDSQILNHSLVEALADAMFSLLSCDSGILLATAPLMRESQSAEVIAVSSGKCTEVQSGTLTEKISIWAQKSPKEVAVIDEQQSLTYEELWERAGIIAANIDSKLNSSRSVVAIALPRSVDFISAALAVLRAGHTFLPIDPRLPVERITFLLENSNCELIVSSHTLEATGWPSLPTLCLENIKLFPEWKTSKVQSDTDAAYVIYTSGSTGVPKGVVVEHRQVVNNLDWRQRNWPLTTKDRVLHNHSFSFDPSIWALFWPLTNGASVVLASTRMMEDTNALVGQINKHQITVLGGVPSLLGALIDNPLASDCRSIKLVLSGGEVLNPELAHNISKIWNATVANLYGPTETTIDALSYTVPENPTAPIPIGSPLDNTQAYIVDADLNLVPDGALGEIMLAGDNLARGYVGNPKETARRFIPNPFGKGRLYSTGDIGRRSVSGEISYLGRRDHQVKIRGHRIELNEVAHLIGQILELHEVIVFAKHAGTEQAYLVAAFCGCSELNTDDIRQKLKPHLPNYLIPGKFLLLDELPRTTTGKVDMIQLESLTESIHNQCINSKERAPKTVLEQNVIDDFAQVLGTDKVTLDSNFFDLGGTSILLTRLAGQLSSRYEVQIPLHEFFRIPTPSSVAEAIEVYRRDGLTALLSRQHAKELEHDIELPDFIRPGELPHANWYKPDVVLLTGATGYLGLHLIEELLKRTDSRIICLCRAKDGQHAKARILEGFDTYSIDVGEYIHRLEFLVGDLSLKHFGLSDEHWSELAEQVDVIYHNGALVNFVYPYSALKSTNVGGTQTILELACTSRLKSVQYISTVDTLLATHSPRPFIEDDAPLRSAVGVPAGYTGSKWVAEAVVNLGSSRGIPVSIYRPGLILGHTKTGASQSIDYLLVALRGFLPMGIVPDYPRIFDIVPVDFVASAIVHISMNPEGNGKFFHLFNPAPVTIRQFCDWIYEFGYDFKIVDFEEGRKRALAVEPGHPLYPLVPLIRDAESEPHRALDPSYIHEVDPTLECKQTFEFLENSDIKKPYTGKEYAYAILSYLIETGFLSSPESLSIDKEEL